LHQKGSTNPLGTGYSLDMIRFYPKYITKDIFGFFCVIFFVAITFLLWNPLNIADSDNFMDADFISTPKHITPE
jgi:quinol-cytochrome oxidoreductase complex cytochrome b subunit